MKHIVYKTTNLVNSKIYVGVHSSKYDTDRYLGSGVRLNNAIKLYGKDKFVRETLFTFDNIDDAYMKESEIVNEAFISRDDTYNIALGGNGGTRKFSNKLKTSERLSIAQKKRMSAPGFIPWNKGKKCDQIGSKPAETRKARGINYFGKNNPMYGIDVSTLMTPEANAERLRKISAANTGKLRSDESKRRYSEVAKSRKWLISKDGVLSTTVDPNDPRLNDPNWQLGRVWKN